MCGIAGLISKEKNINIQHLKLLNDGIAHRGPDDEGYYIKIAENNFLSLKGPDTPKSLDVTEFNSYQNINIHYGFAHRRFSIIDTSISGHQPMIDKESNIAISFNGEIYNYLEIRKELEASGEINFTSGSDTEVVLRAYKKWGVSCFKKFNGFWAIAIFDNEKLILSRDRVGKKPLYYTNDAGFFIFCSEIKPIIELRKKMNLHNSINEKASFDYIALDRRNTNFDSLFNEIKQVQPSTFCVIDTNNFTEINETNFWKLRNMHATECDLDSYSEKFKEVLDSAVNLRLRSDVPLEANLSGGLDSAAIVALASKNLSSNNLKLKTHTFRYVGDNSLDESVAAREIAKFCEADFSIIDIEEKDIWSDIDNLVIKSDEPVHSMAALVQSYAWERIAKDGYKVILHGSANDELMLGYEYLKKIEILNRFKSGDFETLSRDLINEPINLLKLTKWLINETTSNQTFSNYFSTNMNEANIGRADSFEDQLKQINKKTKDRIYEDLTNLRIPYWCNLMDKNMMNVPIEVRMPFLDFKFLEFIFSVPTKYLLRDGYTKYLLRYSLRDLLPNNILWNRKKIGFSNPKGSWRKRGEKQCLSELEDSNLSKFLNIEALKKNIHTIDESLLWRITNFCIWHRVNKL